MCMPHLSRSDFSICRRRLTRTTTVKLLTLLALFIAVTADGQDKQSRASTKEDEALTSPVRLLEQAAISTLNGDHAQAERLYRKAIAATRGNSLSSMKLAVLLSDAINQQPERKEEAARILLQAVTRHGPSLGEENEVVQLAMERLRPMLLELAWEKCTGADSEQADYDAAAEFAEQGVKLRSVVRQYWLLALARVKQGDEQRSLEAINKSLEAGNENWAGQWFIMSMVQAQRGSRQAALDWYHAAQDWIARTNSTFDPNFTMRDHAAEVLGVKPEWPPEDWTNEECLQCFGRLTKSYPQVAQLRVAHSTAALRAEKWDVARRDLLDVVKNLSREIENNPDQLALRTQRGDAYARLGQWEEAIADLESVLQPEDSQSMVWLQAAPVIAIAGDVDRYRNFCLRMMKKFDGSTENTDIERTIKVALLLPEIVDSAQLPIKQLSDIMHGEGVEPWKSGWGWATLALAELRRGNPDRVLVCADKAATFDDYKNNAAQRGMCLMVKAMALLQLNRTREARQVYDAGVDLIQARMAGAIEHNSLIAELLRREAATALSAVPGTTATEDEETLLDAYMRANEGRWVCETVADQDIEGYMKKGERVRMESVRTVMPGRLGLNNQWHLEKDGEIRGRSSGMAVWDPTTNSIRTYGTATGGYRVESCVRLVDNQWTDETTIIYPDGSKATSKGIVTVRENGKVHSVLITDRVDNEGKELPDTTDVWKRVTKGSEVLQEQLSWIIGRWADDENGFDLNCQWAADGNVIEFRWSNPATHGISIILWDAGEQQLKMWGAGSDGGSGQSIITSDGDQFVWHHVATSATGKKSAATFRCAPDGDSAITMGWTDPDTGEDKSIRLMKK